MLSQDVRNGFVYWAKLGSRLALIRVISSQVGDVSKYYKKGLKTPLRAFYRVWDYSRKKGIKLLSGRPLRSVVRPRMVVDDLPVYDMSERGIPCGFRGDTVFVNCRKNYGNILAQCANN